MVYEFDGFIPVINESAYIHPLASIIGNVTIGKNVYIGPGAVCRGDWGEIIIADGCNVQENCTIHMFPGTSVLLEESAHVGHGAVIHGATLKSNCLIGMNAVVMDQAVVGEESIIGALTFVREGFIIPPRSLVVGNPGKIIKSVSDEMIQWKTKGTQLYQSLPKWAHQSLKPIEPLRKQLPNKKQQASILDTWKNIKESNNSKTKD